MKRTALTLAGLLLAPLLHAAGPAPVDDPKQMKAVILEIKVQKDRACAASDGCAYADGNILVRDVRELGYAISVGDDDAWTYIKKSTGRPVPESRVLDALEKLRDARSMRLDMTMQRDGYEVCVDGLCASVKDLRAAGYEPVVLDNAQYALIPRSGSAPATVFEAIGKIRRQRGAEFQRKLQDSAAGLEAQ